MDDSGLSGATERIDRALSRAEAAARRLAPPPAPTPALADAYAKLDERHGLLRLRVQETIDRLDTLIAAPGDR